MPLLTPEERVGTTLDGRYRLDALLGQGGMGVVFAATHTWTGRPVAVKLMAPTTGFSELGVRRFLREARAAASLRHRHVVDVLDMGQCEDGALFLVFERLEGPTLRAHLDARGALSPAETWRLLRPVMSALAAAHERGLVHRDVKPDNVLLHEEEGGVVPKLLDFGVVRMRQSEEASLTETGIAIGTPAYMAPEQVRGERNVGAPADVWSMAVVFHRCLTGRRLFEGATPMAVMSEVLTRHPPPFEESCPELPAPLAAALTRALQRDPSARHADMGAFLAALESALETADWPDASPRHESLAHASTVAARPLEPARTSRSPIRRKATWVAVALGALGVLGGAGWLAASAPRPQPESSAPPSGSSEQAPTAQDGPSARPSEPGSSGSGSSGSGSSGSGSSGSGSSESGSSGSGSSGSGSSGSGASGADPEPVDARATSGRPRSSEPPADRPVSSERPRRSTRPPREPPPERTEAAGGSPGRTGVPPTDSAELHEGSAGAGRGSHEEAAPPEESGARRGTNNALILR